MGKREVCIEDRHGRPDVVPHFRRPQSLGVDRVSRDCGKRHCEETESATVTDVNQETESTTVREVSQEATDASTAVTSFATKAKRTPSAATTIPNPSTESGSGVKPDAEGVPGGADGVGLGMRMCIVVTMLVASVLGACEVTLIVA